MNLQEAISQLVKVGESDPLTIARKIVERNEKKWLRSELEALAEDIIAEMARHELGARRRSAEVALRPGDDVSRGELMLARVWIPGEGWLRSSDVTAEHLRLKANWYEMLQRAARVRAAWYREIAEMMDAEGATTLGKLKAELPPLHDDVDEIAA